MGCGKSKTKKGAIRRARKRGFLLPVFEIDDKGPITILIFDYFSLREIIFLGRVCRTFYDITGHKSVLRRFLRSATEAEGKGDPSGEREEFTGMRFESLNIKTTIC